MFGFAFLFWLILSIAGGVATGWSHAVFSRRQQGSTAGELFSYIVVALVAVLLFKYFDGRGSTPAGKTGVT